MDNLCHTLAGAAMGEAGLKHRTRFGNATLMIASNIPDLDVLVFATSTPAVAFRRGWTHGVLAQVLLPVALTAVILLVTRLSRQRDEPPVNAGWLLALSYIGVLGHVGFDLMNTYGIRLLMPFEPRWFYGDTLFIIDPWLWLMFGLGVWLARRLRNPAPARRALLVAAVYVAVMAAAARGGRAVVLEAWRESRGAEPKALMVGPVPVNPFQREIIVDAGAHYETGTLSWLPVRLTFNPVRLPKHDRDPRVAAAREAPHIRGFLVWARFPFWTFAPAGHGTRVSVHDARFAGRGVTFVETTTVR